MTLQDGSEKNHETIDLGILGHNTIQNKTISDIQSSLTTIEVDKKINKHVA